jgi:hypothetical protein
MSDTPTVTLEFLAQQQAKMLAEMADQRADMDTLLAIMQRLDVAVGGLLNEVHGLQARIEHHGHLPFDTFDRTGASHE